jgi:cell wall-associated NlpC family hydrolase
VAIPRPTFRLLRPLTVLALTAASIGAFPASGDAAPPPAPTTVSQARAQLSALSSQAEIVAEHYNDARVILAKRLREYRTADKQARAIQAQYATLAGQVKHVVSGAYRTVPFGQFTLMLTSTSPREFMDQLSALNVLAGRRGVLINRVASVRAAALKAQTQAQAALSAAQKVDRDITAKRADLSRRKVALEGVLSRLTLQQRYALGADPAGRASRGDSRGPVNVGPASPAALKAVQTALAQRGDPYSWGAAGPSAFDCSGLTMYAWAAAGRGLPHSSSAQYGVGVHVSRSEVRAGDLVFFYNPVHHVGLAINNAQMVHASTYGVPVQVASIDSFPYVGATRLG